MKAKKEPQRIAKPAVKSAAKPEKQSKLPELALLAGILLVALFAFRNGLNAPILPFDDNEYFAAYPEILNLSWSAVKQFFSGYYVLMYQPLPILSFAIQYKLSGLETMPLHLLNLAFHLMNIILVWYFTRQLLKKAMPAVLIAALFALHPLTVEAVTWISARSSGMYTFFFLLSLITYNYYSQRKPFHWFYFLTLLFFILSLFSKAQAVTLPLVLLLIDFYNGRIKDRNVWLNKIPFLALSVLFGLIAILNEGTTGNITDGMMINYNGLDMIFLVFYSYVFYFVKLIFPFNLSAIYVYPPKEGGWLPLEYYLSVLVFLAIIYMVYRLARRDRMYLVGFLMFFITISLNIQLIPSRLFIVTDRYTYFPYIGLFLMIAYALFEDPWTKLPKRQMMRTGILGFLLLYLLVFAWQISERNKVWNDGLVFMTHIIERNPEVPYVARAYGNRANLYLEKGMLEESLNDFSQAIRIQPEDAKSWFNRGVVYANMNQFDKAIPDYDSAIARNPSFDLAYSRKAIACFNSGKPEMALENCNKAVALNKDLAEAWNTRGAVNFTLKNTAEAAQDMEKAVTLVPSNPEYLRNRGVISYDLGRKQEACNDWQRAIDLGDRQSADYYQANCLQNR